MVSSPLVLRVKLRDRKYAVGPESTFSGIAQVEGPSILGFASAPKLKYQVAWPQCRLLPLLSTMATKASRRSTGDRALRSVPVAMLLVCL